MKSLKETCIDQVNLNLNLNYRICVNRNLKIPQELGDKLLENLLKTKKLINDNEVCFFQRDITELSEFQYINGKFNVSNYDFLLGHHLEKFSLKNVKDFSIKNKTGKKLCTKNFFLEQDELPNKEVEDFLRNSLCVEDSIHLKLNDNNDKNLKIIFSLISNCSKKLKILSIKCLPIGLNYFEKFVLKLGEFDCLEELKLDMEYPNLLNKSFGNILLQSIKSSIENIKILEMPKIPFSNFMLISFLEKPKQLEKLSISLRITKEEKNNLNVIRALRSLESLREIYIQLFDANEETITHLSNFLRHSKHLEIIRILFENKKKPNFKELLITMNFIAQNVKAFYIDGMYDKENLEQLKYIFSNCFSLTKIDLIDYKYGKKLFPFLMQAIIQSKNTLREISIQELTEKEIFFFLSNLKECQRIQSLKFRNCSKEDETLKNLIYSCRKTLRIFTWESYSSKFTFNIDFLTVFSKCSFLEKIKFVNCNLRGRLANLFNESSCFLNNLIELSLIRNRVLDSDIIQLINILQRCPHLKILNLVGTFASKRSTDNFCEEIKNLPMILDYFHPPKLPINQKSGIFAMPNKPKMVIDFIFRRKFIREK